MRTRIHYRLGLIWVGLAPLVTACSGDSDNTALDAGSDAQVARCDGGLCNRSDARVLTMDAGQGGDDAGSWTRLDAGTTLEYYVATTGSDSADGSQSAPWKTIGHALSQVPSSGDLTIWVADGVYEESVDAGQDFTAPVWVRAQNAYHAQITNSDNPVIDLGGTSIGFEGFEIAGQSSTGVTTGLVYLYEANGCSLVNNVIRDSYNNDLIRVLFSRYTMLEGNLIYNPFGHDQHLDINSSSQDTTVQENVFFSDYAGSGRSIPDDVKEYITIKTSEVKDGTTRRVNVRRNVFFRYESTVDTEHMISCGMDDKTYFESEDVLLENNLFLLNGMDANGVLGVNESHRITFRANTVVGNASASYFGGRVGRKSSSALQSDEIAFYNNIYSRPDGNMNKFIRSPTGDIASATLHKNLYWNGGNDIPVKAEDLLNYTEDSSPILSDPKLPSAASIPSPRWTGTNFGGGYSTIRAVFEALVKYAIPPSDSPVIDAADPSNMPATDILGRPRGASPDIGAYER